MRERKREQSYASPTVREGGRLLTAREGFKEGAGASGTPSCCTLQEAVVVAESLGAVTEPHGPQEKVSAGRGREVGALGSGPQACWAAGFAEAAPSLGCCSETPRRLQMQGSKCCGQGGWGRAEIPVAPAG